MPVQPDITEDIKNLIKPALDQQQVELVDLIYRWESGPHSGARRDVLRLLIDKAGGVNLDDCTRVNKAVSDILDNTDLIKKSFILEVNSPGLDRPLRTKRDFQKNIGKDIKLIVKNDLGATDTVIGNLKAADGDKLILDVRGKDAQVLLERIIKAKLEIKI